MQTNKLAHITTQITKEDSEHSAPCTAVSDSPSLLYHHDHMGDGLR